MLRIFCLLSGEIDFLIIRLEIKTQQMKQINQTENSDNLTKGLKILRLKYAQNPIIAQININSIKNKFELLVSQIASNIDVLMISETKIDESFPIEIQMEVVF